MVGSLSFKFENFQDNKKWEC